MSVYVDPMLPCLRSRKWKYSMSCHLVADTEEELDRMAKSLGLKRSWRQELRRGMMHYDLTENKRKLAIRCGAIPLPRREFVERFVRPARLKNRRPATPEKGQDDEPSKCSRPYT